MAKSKGKAPSAASLWGEARSQPPQDRSMIPDGDYAARVVSMAKARAKTGKKTVYYILKLVGLGEIKGRSLSKMFFINSTHEVSKRINIEQLSSTLQILLPDTDWLEVDFAEVPEYFEEITDEKGYVKIGIRNRKDNNDQNQMDVYVNALLDEEEAEEFIGGEEDDAEVEDDDDGEEGGDEEEYEEEDEDEDDSEEEEDDSEEDDEEDEEDEEDDEEEEEDEEDEEEEYIPSKGDTVLAKITPRSRKQVECEVTKVLKKAKTVDIAEIDGDRTRQKVSWDDIELVDDEDE